MPTQLNADVNYLTDKNDEVFYPVTHQKAVVDDNGTPLTQILDNLKPETLTKVTWAQLVELRNNGQLIPGNGYRITDYVATTSQAETMSAMHPFDIIVVALSENTLGEEARAIQHSEGFVSIEIDNTTYPYVDTVIMTFSNGVRTAINRFYSSDDNQQWTDNSGNLLASGLTHEEYTSSGDEFVTEYPYAPVSEEEFGSWKINYADYFETSKLSAWKIWYCLDNDANRFAWATNCAFIKATLETYGSNGGYVQRIPWFDNDNGEGSGDSTYQYAWGTFGDANDFDPTNFLYSQYEYVSVGDSLKRDGDLAEVTEAVTGKGVIYRMIDEWNNDCPYDFKGILFNRYRVDSIDGEGVQNNDIFSIKPYTSDDYTVQPEAHPVYTFSMIETIDSNNMFYPYDVSVEQWKFLSDEGVYDKTRNNKIGQYHENSSQNKVLFLNNNAFINTTGYCCIEESYGEFYGIHDITFKSNCFDNTICCSESGIVFGMNCYRNLIKSCTDIVFAKSCRSNLLLSCYRINVKEDNVNNLLTSSIDSNIGYGCEDLTIHHVQFINILGANSNLYLEYCSKGTIGIDTNNSSIKRITKFTIGSGCNYITIQPQDLSAAGSITNVDIANGLRGTYSSNPLLIELENNLPYETRVGLDSSGNLVIHCLEDGLYTINVDDFDFENHGTLPSELSYSNLKSYYENNIPVMVNIKNINCDSMSKVFFLTYCDDYVTLSTIPEDLGIMYWIQIMPSGSDPEYEYWGESNQLTKDKVQALSSSSTHAQYPSAKAVYDFANMTDEERLEYQAKSQYLTFEAAEAGVEITLYRYNSNTSQYTVQVSLNGGAWTSYTSPAYSASDNGVLIGTLAKGDKLRVKSSQTPGDNENSVRGNRFAINGVCYVYGNIMSLGYEDDFATQTAIRYDGDYHNLFFGQTDLRFKKYNKLVLPATTLKTECYSDMFHGCTGITEAPTLPATNVLPYCYNGMFMGCSNLSSIKCLGTTFGNYSLTDFANNTSASGTFYKPTAATWTTGGDGIPSGWEVVDL